MLKRLKRKRYIFFGLLLIGVLFQLSINLIRGYNSNIIIIWPKPDVAHPVLQLNTFNFVTIAPAPTNIFIPSIPIEATITPTPEVYCPHDNIKKDSCKCLEREDVVNACPIDVNAPCPTPYDLEFWQKLPAGWLDATPPPDWYCIKYPSYSKQTQLPGCVMACVGKPVVYLYPTKPTLVSVTVEAPGRIFVSDPLYPDGGWKDVLAHPDGTLLYKDKKYSELFYETSVTKKIAMPEQGIIIPSSELEQVLRSSIALLGLIQKEQDEFLEYWVPVLQNLHSPYIFFSVLTPNVKDSVDRLVISPKPDTKIEFIAYFKPLEKPITIRPLNLPETPPQRIGFTEVEWGGTIGY